MSDCEIDVNAGTSPRHPRLSILLAYMTSGLGRRRPLDIGSMSDHLRRDIGLPADHHSANDRDINVMNVTLASGAIFPRPC